MAFLAPLPWPPTGNDVYVVLDDGTRVEGYLSSYSGTRAARLTVKDEAKVKHKLDEARVVELGVKLEGRPQRMAGSVAEAIRSGKDEHEPIEHVVFKRV